MYDARMLKALKRLLSRKTDALTPRDIKEAVRETGLVVRDAAYYGAGPAMRMYLNRGEDHYQDHPGMDGWHYTAKYSRLPAPTQESLERQADVVRRAAARAGWL